MKTDNHQRRMNRALLSSILCAGFCLLLVFPGISPAQNNPVQNVRVAPDFSLQAVDGRTLKLANLQGSVVLLEFFQTECANCQVAAPKLEFLYQKYKSLGLAVVAVSFDAPTDSPAERVKAISPFVKKFGLTYPVLLGDRSIWVNYIQKAGFNSPMVVFIDRRGMIAAQIEEGPDHKACDLDFLEGVIKQLLK